MITWLQNFFLKHNKWLFGSLLVVIIVTFVLTIGPQSFFGSGSGMERESVEYYGYDLSSESDQRALIYGAEISAILHPELQLRRNQLMDYAYLRAAGLGLANQLGIPEPDSEDLAAFVETLQVFTNPTTGEFSREFYQNMIDSLEGNDRYSREAIARVMQEDFRIHKVREALGGPDYTLSYELEQQFLDRQTTYDVALAKLNYRGFNPEINPDEEALRQYYRENPSRYEIAERISVTALLFTGEAYLEEVDAPNESELEAWFTANQADYQPETEPGPSEETAEETPDVTLADVRDEVIADWKLEKAKQLAARKSEQFSIRLWQEGIAKDSPEYQSLLEEFGVQTMSIPAYERNQPPRMANIPQELLNSMWIYANNPNRYFSDISRTDNGAVLVVMEEVQPARMPEFEEVEDSVRSDYRSGRKRQLFAEEGRNIRQSLQEKLDEEKFAQAAESLGLTVEDLEAFSGPQLPQELRRTNAWDQARFLETGGLSEMVIDANFGTIIYMQNKEVPEIDRESEEFQEFVSQRTAFLNEAMGWARLREITDKTLTAVLGPTEIE